MKKVVFYVSCTIGILMSVLLIAGLTSNIIDGFPTVKEVINYFFK